MLSSANTKPNYLPEIKTPSPTGQNKEGYSIYKKNIKKYVSAIINIDSNDFFMTFYHYHHKNFGDYMLSL